MEKKAVVLFGGLRCVVWCPPKCVQTQRWTMRGRAGPASFRLVYPARLCASLSVVWQPAKYWHLVSFAIYWLGEGCDLSVRVNGNWRKINQRRNCSPRTGGEFYQWKQLRFFSINKQHFPRNTHAQMLKADEQSATAALIHCLWCTDQDQLSIKAQKRLQVNLKNRTSSTNKGRKRKEIGTWNAEHIHTKSAKYIESRSRPCEGTRSSAAEQVSGAANGLVNEWIERSGM